MTLYVIFLIALIVVAGCACSIGYSSGKLENQKNNQKYIDYLIIKYEKEHEAFVKLRNSKNYAEYAQGNLQQLHALQNNQDYQMSTPLQCNYVPSVLGSIFS